MLKFFPRPHFKNFSEYLTRDAAQVVILLMLFLLYSLVSNIFLVFLRYFIYLFLWSALVWWCPLPIIICRFSFHRTFWFFSWFGWFIPSVISCFPLIIIRTALFSMPDFLCMYWLYILTACISFSYSFKFSVNTLIMFPSNFVSWCPPVHFQSVGFSRIIAITNSNGDSTSPWKIYYYYYYYN